VVVALGSGSAPADEILEPDQPPVKRFEACAKVRCMTAGHINNFDVGEN